jgi:glucose/arabinose dehydrogenase
MKRIASVLAVALVVAACSDPASDGTVQPVTTSTSVAGPVVPTTVIESTTTTPDASSDTAVPPTTTMTLAPLQALAYERVATAGFPMVLIPDVAGDRDLVLTRAGLVADLTTGDVLLDISANTRTDGERGLLGGVVGPAELGDALFLHYSDGSGDTTVSRFDRTAGGFDVDSERILLQVDQPAGNHNGGGLVYADGSLYLGLGDGGGANDQFGQGQNFDTLLAGIVRIDPESGESSLWAGGLRNPFRIWFDTQSGTLAIADVGQNALEEVSIVPLDDQFRNFGWPITEGFSCFQASDCDTTGITQPVLDISHGDAGTCSITGGVTYRGSAIPEIAGEYFFSDFCGGWLRSVSVAEPHEVTDWTSDVGVPGQVVGFGTDRDGEMYVLTTSEILKVVPQR